MRKKSVKRRGRPVKESIVSQKHYSLAAKFINDLSKLIEKYSAHVGKISKPVKKKKRVKKV